MATAVIPKLQTSIKTIEKHIADIVTDYTDGGYTWRQACEARGISPSMAWRIANDEKMRAHLMNVRAWKAKDYAEACTTIADDDARDASQKALSIKTRQWLASAYDKATYAPHQTIDTKQVTVAISAPSRPEPVQSVDISDTADVSDA
jgi:hypothetical protein